MKLGRYEQLIVPFKVTLTLTDSKLVPNLLKKALASYIVFKTVFGRCTMIVSFSRWMGLNNGTRWSEGEAKLRRAGMRPYMLMHANIAKTAPWQELMLSCFLARTTCAS